MCHRTDSRPPAPPAGGAVAEHGPLTLTSADGTELSAYRAVPAAPNGRSIVLLPDIRGLHPYYQDLAQRFAEAGFTTVAIDYYGRTAGTTARDDAFAWQPHLAQLTADQVRDDVAAALATLDGPVYSVGFCFGGSHSWRLAASDLDLAGVVGFYGRPALVRDVVGAMKRPLLLLVAGADAATPLPEFHEFDAQLTAAGVRHELHVYDGAPHSFFDRAHAQWQDACQDAWRRILDFTR